MKQRTRRASNITLTPAQLAEINWALIEDDVASEREVQ
jgi:hypothetical protein